MRILVRKYKKLTKVARISKQIVRKTELCTFRIQITPVESLDMHKKYSKSPQPEQAASPGLQKTATQDASFVGIYSKSRQRAAIGASPAICSYADNNHCIT